MGHICSHTYLIIKGVFLPNSQGSEKSIVQRRSDARTTAEHMSRFFYCVIFGGSFCSELCVQYS